MHRWLKWQKGLSWVTCNSAVSDEKYLQIFSLFYSFHLKWKFITSSMWCFMLYPSTCCRKEVGWLFILYLLNWSHAINYLYLMATTGFALFYQFSPCYLTVSGVVLELMAFCPKGYQECIGIIITIFLSSISGILQYSNLFVGHVFKMLAILDVSFEVLQLKMS